MMALPLPVLSSYQCPYFKGDLFPWRLGPEVYLHALCAYVLHIYLFVCQ